MKIIFSFLFTCTFILVVGQTIKVNCETYEAQQYDSLHTKQIDTLIISECAQITSLPEQIERMVLTSLHFYWIGTGDDQINFSPIGSIAQLEELKLGPYGQIDTLPDSFMNLTNLKILDMQLTDVRNLPDWIGRMESLEEINLAMTPLSSLPIEALQNLKKLRVLNLTDTSLNEEQIQEIEEKLKAEVIN